MTGTKTIFKMKYTTIAYKRMWSINSNLKRYYKIESTHQRMNYRPVITPKSNKQFASAASAKIDSFR